MICQAQVEGLTLITCNSQFPAYGVRCCGEWERLHLERVMHFGCGLDRWRAKGPQTEPVSVSRTVFGYAGHGRFSG